MCVLAGTLFLAATACGGDDTDSEAAVSVEVPDDATFCSVFSGQYRSALDAAVPATDAGFDDSSATITAWAEVLNNLAPTEIGDQAEANVGYHRAQQNKQSASDFVPGSNEMHEWADSNC